MSEPFDLLCVASGGREIGLGHVSRSIELARAADARGWRIALALRGDDSLETVLEAALPDVPRLAWKSAGDLLGLAPRVLFDTRDDYRAELSALARRGHRSLVLDRDDLVEAADWTILPVLHAEVRSHPRVRMGGAWCIVPEAVRRMQPPAASERDVLLVSFGGADPLDLTERLAAPIARAQERWRGGRAPALHGVVGPSFARPERAAAALAAAGFVVHRAPAQRDFAALSARAAAALVGFGTTVNELAWLGVPFASLTHHRGDGVHAERLERLGVGAAGGFGAALDEADLVGLLERSVFDPAFRDRTARRGAALLEDGCGAARILALLAEDER